jgi:hypothetical protein
VGDVRGRQLTSVVAPEETRRAREIFARNLVGPRAGSDNKVVVIDAEGERLSVEVSAVPLQSGDRVIGVFGQLLDVEEEDPPPPPHPRLTPRQAEVLRLLEHGRSTVQIADELHLSTETVRNHIRHMAATRLIPPHGATPGHRKVGASLAGPQPSGSPTRSKSGWRHFRLVVENGLHPARTGQCCNRSFTALATGKAAGASARGRRDRFPPLGR